MVETWAMAVLRDVPFISGWKTVASLTPFIAFLNTLEHDAPTDATGNITLGTVFRGAGVDELLGSYVSQYLLLPFDYGGLRVELLGGARKLRGQAGAEVQGVHGI